MTVATLPTHVFILNCGEYIEIPYDTLKSRLEQDVSWSRRKFLRFGDILMEVQPSDYHEYYRYYRRQAYIAKCAADHGVISLDDERGRKLLFQLEDSQPDVHELVEQKIMVETLQKAIARLNPEEHLMIRKYYYEDWSQREMARQYGISHQSVGMRLKRIILKLQAYFDNNM